MRETLWLWIAILVLLGIQLWVVHLTHECFKATIECIKAIREALGGSDGDNDRG